MPRVFNFQDTAMFSKILLTGLLAAVLATAPLIPGTSITAKVAFMNYACAPCASAEAFQIREVIGGGHPQLVGKDVVLYYRGKGRYLRDDDAFMANDYAKLGGYYRPAVVRFHLRRRSLWAKVWSSDLEADVEQWWIAKEDRKEK